MRNACEMLVLKIYQDFPKIRNFAFGIMGNITVTEVVDNNRVQRKNNVSFILRNNNNSN